jgi:hypothetical protein
MNGPSAWTYSTPNRAKQALSASAISSDRMLRRPNIPRPSARLLAGLPVMVAARRVPVLATGAWAPPPVQARPLHTTLPAQEGVLAFNQLQKTSKWEDKTVELARMIETFRQLQAVELLRNPKPGSEAQTEYRVRASGCNASAHCFAECRTRSVPAWAREGREEAGQDQDTPERVARCPAGESRSRLANHSRDGRPWQSGQAGGAGQGGTGQDCVLAVCPRPVLIFADRFVASRTLARPTPTSSMQPAHEP